MNRRSKITFLFVAVAALLAGPITVAACSCPNTDDTVLGKFEAARFVVVARVVSVEKVPELKTTYSGNKEIQDVEAVVESTKMVVLNVYKGNLKAGSEMIFAQGQSESCLRSFDDDDIGGEFLFYLSPKDKAPQLWYAEGCGKSKPLTDFSSGMVEYAADDLSFLAKKDQVKGKTRISGTLISFQWSFSDGGASFNQMAGRKVRIIGEKKTYEAVTDEDGVYEIYGLPPGRYTVQPEVVKGWEVEKGSAWGGGGSGSNEESERFQVSLKSGRHAYFDFFFKVDNRLRGRVLDPLGKPIKDVRVKLLPNQGKVSEDFDRGDWTNADGKFAIEEIPFGSYVIVLNEDARISSYEPFKRFYYPNVYEREKAMIIDVNEGDELEAIEIRIPEMREVATVEGSFLSSDGKPVTGAGIFFKAENTDELVDGNAFGRTDENGKFLLRVLKGLHGEFVGEVTVHESEFKDCPQVIALLKEKGGLNWRSVRTDASKIQTQNDVGPVELMLPFPSCNGAKIVSRIRID